ncbi:MAG: hypothetical protein N4A45_10340 [Flavobacteriales bacterium]|jgi:hypothetical protein|nr:hypothetical protein [Flavobacteriales bacterium]
MIRLLLNHQEVDVYNTSIKYVAQSFLVGDIEKRQASFAPKIKIVRNAKSTNALNNVGFSGHTSTAYNQIIRADLWENGVLRITNGVFKLTDSLNLEGVIYTKEKTFFEWIKGKTISELDFSFIPTEINNSVSQTNWMGALNKRAVDFCFPIQEFIAPKDPDYSGGAFIGTSPHMDDGYILSSQPKYPIELLPIVLYVKGIVTKIFNESGFEVRFPVSSDIDNEVINTKLYQNYLHGSFGYNDKAYHDISQEKFLKAFLVRFGLVLKQMAGDGFELVFVKDILNASFGITDWSAKFSEVTSIQHNLQGYGKENKVKAKIKRHFVPYVTTNASTGELEETTLLDYGFAHPNRNTWQDDYLFNLSNEHLIESKGIWNWLFENYADELFQDSTSPFNMAFNVYGHIKYISPTVDNEIKFLDEEQPIRLYNIKRVSNGDNDYKPLKLYTGNLSGINQPEYNVLRQDKTMPKYYIDTYWQEWIAMLDNHQLHTVMLNLTREDVINFDIKKPIHIKQLGGLFYVNKIHGYNPRALTKVELIKIK